MRPLFFLLTILSLPTLSLADEAKNKTRIVKGRPPNPWAVVEYLVRDSLWKQAVVAVLNKDGLKESSFENVRQQAETVAQTVDLSADPASLIERSVIQHFLNPEFDRGEMAPGGEVSRSGNFIVYKRTRQQVLYAAPPFPTVPQALVVPQPVGWLDDMVWKEAIQPNAAGLFVSGEENEVWEKELAEWTLSGVWLSRSELYSEPEGKDPPILRVIVEFGATRASLKETLTALELAESSQPQLKKEKEASILTRYFSIARAGGRLILPYVADIILVDTTEPIKFEPVGPKRLDGGEDGPVELMSGGRRCSEEIRSAVR